MKQTSLFSVTDIVDFAQCCQNAVGRYVRKLSKSLFLCYEKFLYVYRCRYKQLFLVNLPSFAVFLLDVARTTLSDKLKQRIVLAKNMEDLKNFIDPNILPKEHGGQIPEAEQIETFNAFFKSVRPKLEEIKERVVDWSKVPDLSSKTKEAVGSFRKLDID